MRPEPALLSPTAFINIDDILQAALDAYENSLDNTQGNVSGAHILYNASAAAASSSSSHLCPTTERFATPKSGEEITEARMQGVPFKTEKDTKYCVCVWESWKEHRIKTTKSDIAPLSELSHSELDYWLTRFVLEARKKDGCEYPPNSLHHICCGLMRYLRWNGQPSIDPFTQSDFTNFRASLDSELKRLQSKGVGSIKKQAKVLTKEEEDILWKERLLGDSSLLDTMVFCNGLYFALRSGQEHRQLRSNPCQIELIERPGEKSYLKYTEDI